MLTLYLDHEEELLRADQDILYVSGIVSTSIWAFSHKEQTAFEKSSRIGPSRALKSLRKDHKETVMVVSSSS